MTYVDLNPIRADIAKTPEDSVHTSVQQRINAAKKGQQPASLCPFVGNPRHSLAHGLPFELLDYLQLIELTGRCLREDKSGYIQANIPSILTRLNICPENWFIITKQFSQVFHGAVGHEQVLTDYCQHQHLKQRGNLGLCNKLLA